LQDVDATTSSLARVCDSWSLYCSQLLHIRNIFLVLDRRLHSDSTQPYRSIEELGVQEFKKQWDRHPTLAQNVFQGCLATIRAERTGQLIDRHLLRRLLSMLSSLNCFTSQFKPMLIADLERFFAEESARMLCDSEVSVFLIYCERRLKEEAENLGAVMSASDCADLMRAIQRVLLEVNVDAILSNGFAVLVDSSRFHDLSRIYTLFELVNAHAALRARFVSYMKATGLPLVQNEAKDKEMIVNLLDLRKRMVDIVDQSFGSSRSFRDTIKEAFDSFINSRQNKPAEMLAKYMSAILRGEVVSDVGDEVLLDRSMELFRHLQVQPFFVNFVVASRLTMISNSNKMKHDIMHLKHKF
jgi:cullin-4